MKVYILVFLFVLFLYSCAKQVDVKPATGNVAATPPTTTADTTKKTKPDTTGQISHDDSVHLASFNLKAQSAKLAVSDKTVTLNFDENVDILYTQEGYQETYGVFLTEDFSKTVFSGFDFTTVAEAGNTTFDWVDSNLNNVILKSITDTVINDKKMVKINVHRAFSFFKNYGSNLEALTEKSLISKKTDDKVTFSSYSYYNHKYYPARSVTTSVVYSG